MQISNVINVKNSGVLPSQHTVAKQNENTGADITSDILEISEQAKSQSNQITATSGQTQSSRTYSADIGRMREIWTEHDRHVESFRKLFQSLIEKQAEKAGQSGTSWNYNDPNAMVDIDDATRAAATEAVEEGGAFSVETVATRLLDFAVAISGGDPSKISILKNAVERGFANAERQWGGELPEISQKTREAVMNGFDEWQKAGDASAISILNK